MWEEKHINLGQVIVGREITINFVYKGQIEIVKNLWGRDDINASCGCTSAKFNKETNSIEVKFTPNPVPKHLALEGKTSYSSQKSITVRYKNSEGVETTDRLTFSATIKI